MIRIVIEVEGGAVTEVTSDSTNVEYVVIDHDNIKAGDPPPGEEDFISTSYCPDLIQCLSQAGD
jgi:hypothetical protein